MKRTLGIFSFIVSCSFLMGMIAYTCYLMRTDQEKVRNPSTIHKSAMIDVFSNRSINYFFSRDWPEGKVYWFDPRTDARFKGINPLTETLYGVRIDASTPPLKINGVRRPEVVGLIAYPGIDGQVNYSETERSVVEYNVLNGVKSGGDVIFVFTE